MVTARDRIDWTLNDAHALSFGIDFETYQATLDIRAPFPPKEGEDRGQRLSSRDLVTAKRDTEIWNLAGWLEHKFKPFGESLWSSQAYAMITTADSRKVFLILD